MSHYKNCVERGVCSACNGRKNVVLGGGPNGDDDCMVVCFACGGSGEPTAKDRALAALEEKGLCTRCQLPEQVHPESFNCLQAAVSEVRRLSAEMAVVQEKLKILHGAVLT